MRIGFLADLYSFRVGSGTYTFTDHVVKMFQDMGHKVDILFFAEENVIRATSTVGKTIEYFEEKYDCDFYFARKRLYYHESIQDVMDNYLEQVEPDLLFFNYHAEYLALARDEIKCQKVIYHHAGNDFYVEKNHDNLNHAIKKLHERGFDQICATNSSAKYVIEQGVEPVRVLPPFLPDPIEAQEKKNIVSTMASSMIMKAVDEMQAVCDSLGVEMRRYGTQAIHLMPEEVPYALSESKAFFHFSQIDLAPYACLEASLYCPVVVDKTAPWHDDNYIHDIIRVDINNKQEIRDAITSEFKPLDLRSYQDDMYNGWERYFSSVLSTVS